MLRARPESSPCVTFYGGAMKRSLSIRVRARTALDALGEDATLWIDPATVGTGVVPKFPYLRRLASRVEPGVSPSRRRAYRLALKVDAALHPFVLDESAYPQQVAFDARDKVHRIVDLVRERHRPEASAWWCFHAAKLGEEGEVRLRDRTVRDEAGLAQYVDEYLLPLIESIEQDGWRQDRATSPGSVLVGPDGSLHKAEKGTHRFAIARAVGVPLVPLRVRCVHHAWWSSSTSGRSGRARLASTRDALRGVAEAHRR